MKIIREGDDTFTNSLNLFAITEISTSVIPNKNQAAALKET